MFTWRISVVVFCAEKQYNAEETITNAKEKEIWQTKRRQKKIERQDNIQKPLFTGDYLHDTVVTEFEKAAEASNAIFNAIKGKLNRRKKNSKEG